MTTSVACELGRLRTASSWRRWSIVVGVAGFGGIVVVVAARFGPVTAAIAAVTTITWVGLAIRSALDEARSWRRVHGLARSGRLGGARQ